MTDITELDEDCFFGPAPLRADEDHAAYYALLKSLKDTVQPLDIFERIWIRDVADLVWEILRWRRDKLNLVKAKDTKSLKYLDKDAVLIDRSAKIDDIIS